MIIEINKQSTQRIRSQQFTRDFWTIQIYGPQDFGASTVRFYNNIEHVQHQEYALNKCTEIFIRLRVWKWLKCEKHFVTCFEIERIAKKRKKIRIHSRFRFILTSVHERFTFFTSRRLILLLLFLFISVFFSISSKKPHSCYDLNLFRFQLTKLVFHELKYRNEAANKFFNGIFTNSNQFPSDEWKHVLFFSRNCESNSSYFI